MNIRVQFKDYPSVLYTDVTMLVVPSGALELRNKAGFVVAAFPAGFWTMAEEEVNA